MELPENEKLDLEIGIQEGLAIKDAILCAWLVHRGSLGEAAELFSSASSARDDGGYTEGQLETMHEVSDRIEDAIKNTDTHRMVGEFMKEMKRRDQERNG
jgi:hypothetical protein